MSIVDSIVEFAAAVRVDRAANPETVGEGAGLELLLAPRFQALIEAVLPEVAATRLSVLPEFRRSGVGRPDLALKRQGEPARGRCHVNHRVTSLWAPTPEIMQRSSLAATVSSRRRGIGGVFGGRPDGVGR